MPNHGITRFGRPLHRVGSPRRYSSRSSAQFTPTSNGADPWRCVMHVVRCLAILASALAPRVGHGRCNLAILRVGRQVRSALRSQFSYHHNRSLHVVGSGFLHVAPSPPIQIAGRIFFSPNQIPSQTSLRQVACRVAITTRTRTAAQGHVVCDLPPCRLAVCAD